MDGDLPYVSELDFNHLGTTNGNSLNPEMDIIFLSS